MMVNRSAENSAFRIPPYLRPAVYDHAIETFPEECCGIVVQGPDGKLRYRRSENLSPEDIRETAFTLDPAIYEPAREDGSLVAIVHSHTRNQRWPSREDMASQVTTNVPWVIVVMDRPEHVVEEFTFPLPLTAPLKQVDFRPGVADCKETIRRFYFQEYGVTLPYVPRDHAWWAPEDGAAADDFFMDLFEMCGFRRLLPEEVHLRPDDKRSPLLVRRGDVGLTRVLSPNRLNHGVIYTGGQLMIHHLLNRVSAEEPVSLWLPRIEVWLRHRCNELQPSPETAREDNPPLRSAEG